MFIVKLLIKLTNNKLIKRKLFIS